MVDYQHGDHMNINNNNIVSQYYITPFAHAHCISLQFKNGDKAC
jgi:hypothetical protein